MQFVSERPIGRMSCDFFIPSLRVVVEADGDYWHGQPAAAARDRAKDNELRRRGIAVIRLRESEVERGEAAHKLHDALAACNGRRRHPAPAHLPYRVVEGGEKGAAARRDL